MGSERIVDVLSWRARGVDHRIEIVERPDGLFTLCLLRFRTFDVLEDGDVPGGWAPLPLEVVLADTIERARELAADVRRRYE